MFHRKRSAATSWTWLIILLIFPVLGFILYGFIRRRLSQENLFAIGNQKYIDLNKADKTIPRTPEDTEPIDTSKEAKVLIDCFNFKHDSPLSENNKISFYTGGEEKFKTLSRNINQAKETINAEYYSFMNDNLENQFFNLLIKEAREGVKVGLIYDPQGSSGASKAWFKLLTDLGREVAAFITAQNTIKKCRMNYHLHHKIVVIGGRISWTDGFNVDDQYVSKGKKFGYWRDTHPRIVDPASLLFQERSVMNWNASVTNKNETVSFNEKLFPEVEENRPTKGDITTRIVLDGPDTSIPYLRNGMTRMMMVARKALWIQTPYLVPGDSMIAIWVIAARSGVDVGITIPSMFDHPFICRTTQWYTNYLLHGRVKIYIYNNGLTRTKTVMVDEHFSAVGSVNQDFRSYSLNFEADAVFYDKNIARELNQIFKKDLTNCTELALDITNNWPCYFRFKQAFSRLSSPTL